MLELGGTHRAGPQMSLKEGTIFAKKTTLIEQMKINR